MFNKKHPFIKLLRKDMWIAIGLVLIWRGLWYVFDGIDIWLFGGSHVLSGVLGIVVGLLILYIPDRDLKEIERL